MDFDWIGLAFKAGTIIVIGIGILVVLGICFLAAWYYGNNKSYKKYKVIIFERIKDKKDKTKEMPIIISTSEQGRVMYDKKMKHHYFELKNIKVKMGEEELKNYDEERDLDIPHIPSESGQRIVFVEKLGVKKYAFGEVFSFEGKVSVRVSNADVAEGIRMFDMNAKTFGKKNAFNWAIAGYIILCCLILILMIVFMTKFEGLKEVISGANQYASAIAQSKAVTVASTAPH